MRLFIGILTTIVIVALILIFMVKPAQAPQRESFSVVGTIFPLADWLREIGGSDVTVHCLVAGAANPHHFEPSTRDAVRISQARAVFAIGLGLDVWAEKLVKNAGRGDKLTYFETGKWIASRKISAVKTIISDAHESHEHCSNEIGDDDPHYWLDPRRATVVVRQMADALSQLDPAHREGYLGRAASYIEKLEALDITLRKKADQIPPGAQIVTFHDAYGYLLERLNIKLAAVVQMCPGVEPSLKDMIEAERIMREIRQRVVFVELQESSKAATLIAERLGAKVETLDPMDSEVSQVGKTYLERLTHNFDLLAKAVTAP
ncbi:MAG: metal ABC transporter substrate-binding protein [Planctomycetota bacterium]